jgi:polyketide synthase PksN
VKEQFLIGSDHPMLRDHVVHGRHLMPGLAYIDLVYQFLRSTGQPLEELELRDLSIYEPLAVSTGKPVLLTVEASLNLDDSLKILIQSEAQTAAADGSTGEPRRHVIVHAHRVPPASFVETIDMPAIQKSAFAIDIDQIYGHYSDLGLKHGDFMKVHGSVYVADNAVYADVTLSNAAIAAADAILFNPALLDGSAVCGSVGLAHAKALTSRRLSLPLYFRKFRASAQLSTSCIARLRTDQVRRRNEISYVTLEFFNREGRKIAELCDLGGTAGIEAQRAESVPPVAVAAQATAVESLSPEGDEQGSLVSKVEQMLRDCFAAQGRALPANVDSSLTFAELGVDSAGLLQLLRELEIKLDTPLSPTLLFEYGNLNELATHLADTHGDLLLADIRKNEMAPEIPPEIPREIPVEQAIEVPASAAIETFLRGHIARSVGIAPERLDPNSPFSDLGVDSAGLLSLLETIESQVGVGLSPTLLFEYHSLAELTEYLSDHHAAALQASLGNDVAAVASAPSQSPPAPLPDAGIRVANATPSHGDIAIIGISGRFPGAGSVEELWEVLKSGRDCITEIPQERWDYRKYRYYEDYARWGDVEFCHWGGFIDDVDKFEAGFFNIQPIQADCMDPQERLFLQTTWQLLESAGYTRARLRAEHQSRVGVYVGSMYRDYSHIEADIGQELGSFLGFHSSLANRVSHFFDLQGPSLALDTMCSSTAVAIHTACRDLLFGDCELAVVGGVNLSLHHKKFLGLSHEKQIGTNVDSRSFSNSNGYLPAEAVGAVLLKPLASAVAGRDRILGVIKATAVNHSGRSNGYTVPNPTAQAQVIEECLHRAGVDPSTVSYVEATSNGSMFGDPMELVALNKVFSKRTSERGFCSVGTVKSNIGHAEAASALTQLAKVVLQFEHRQLPPSIKTEPLHPLTTWTGTAFALVHELQDWKQPTVSIDGRQQTFPRRAILNSFGAGGTNASLLLEEFIAPAEVAKPAAIVPGRKAEIIVLSARTPDRVPVMLRRLYEHMHRHPQLTLPDIAYTLQLGREAMSVRVAIVASSREELMSVLERSLQFNPEVDRAIPADLPLFFGDGKETVAVRGLIDGNAGKALIEVLVKENDASRLALLWTQGAVIPWRLMHAAGSARAVHLPTYPFKQDRHWLTSRDEQPAPSNVPAERRFAPTFFSNANATRTHIAPRNDIERSIAELWTEALGIEELSVTDGFFELGGNSLLATAVIARLSELFEVDVDWGILLGGEATIEGFAKFIVARLAAGMNEHDLEAKLAIS